MTTFSVKLDENLGLSHVHFLRQKGYDADRVHDEGLSGEPDDSLWQHILMENRFFITLDLDFSDVRQFPPGDHPGILLMRPRNNSSQATMHILVRVLEERSLESLEGCFVVADESHTRIRRPLVD